MAFWADEIASTVIDGRPGRPLYRVHDYKTPSGHFHVGSLRGVIIHSMVARAIAAQNKTVEFTWGYDDYDPMDGFPVYLDESFRQYMGKPLSEIPAPDRTFQGSYARYFADEFTAVINKLGINPTIVYISQLYKSGAFNEAIKLALNNAEKIRQINSRISGSQKGSDWYPISVICQQCGKIGTTRAYAWDGQLVSYICEPTMVKWAAGCGHSGQTDPYDGRAKLPWKIEWAAKWLILDEDFETAGKDHMTKNGSHDVAAAIAREIFAIEAPLGRQYPYEFLLVGGKKMSSSKALGVTASQISEMLPPHLLSFLIGSGKPNRQIDFSPDGNTMPLLYDAYDAALAAYRTSPESDLAKIISYTMAPNQITPDYVMRFSKVSFVSQMPNLDIWQEAETEKGATLTVDERTELTERIEYAKYWLKEFAPDELKFTLQIELPPIDLTGAQQEFLSDLANFIEQQNPDGTALHAHIHQLRAEHQLSPREAFAAIYRLFLNKDSGPQAGWFLAALERSFVLERLKAATRSVANRTNQG